jgi:hypothetical protein
MTTDEDPVPLPQLDEENDRLPDGAVVIRFGESVPETLRKTALAHHDERGDFAISAVSRAGATADELASLGALAHPKIRETTVGRIRAAGYDVISDELPEGHALIMLPRLPADDDWTAISDLFDPPRLNPATE